MVSGTASAAGAAWTAGGRADKVPALLESIRNGGQQNLTSLDLSGCSLSSLPEEVLLLKDLQTLNLGDNTLSSLPAGIGALVSLRVLFFLRNSFSSLPPSLASLPSLETLSFKENKLSSLEPSHLPRSLRALILTSNRLSSIPPGLSGLPNLLKLMVAQNRLESLPADLHECKKLELLRAANNHLTHIPPSLWAMPALAWVALSGSPAMAQPPRLRDPPLKMDDFEVGAQIGQGASGKVYKTKLKAPPHTPVALKVFHEADTISDGSPELELRISAMVRHPAVQRLVATVREPQLAAAFELLPERLVPLASPPSLATATRDIYAPAFSLTLPALLRAATSLAAGLAVLHEKGIAHGDFYAHNIMMDATTGEAVLLDFGAAFTFRSSEKEGAHTPGSGAGEEGGAGEQAGAEGGGHQVLPGEEVQRIEVCAFGRLLSELISHLSIEQSASPPGRGNVTVLALSRLAQECTGSEVSSRPLMPQVLARIQDLAKSASASSL